VPDVCGTPVELGLSAACCTGPGAEGDRFIGRSFNRIAQTPASGCVGSGAICRGPMPVPAHDLGLTAPVAGVAPVTRQIY